MNSKQRGALFLVLMTFVLVSTVIDPAENGALADPGSSSHGSSWGSSKPSGSGGYKKKSSTKSKLKKADVIGAGIYAGDRLGKLTSRFGSYKGGGNYSWNDYNSWREVDGFLCRNTNDCNWIDNQLYCQDYKLDFEPSALWFGGDVARIVGECACHNDTVFHDRELECQTVDSTTTTVTFGIGAIIASHRILVLLCACGCWFFATWKIL